MTYVAVRSETAPTVVGYYTLAAGAVAFSQLPPAATKKLPRHPVPVVLLARLAVNRSAQGQGIGAAMLMDALRRALEVSKSLGVHAVEVVAIDEQAAAFYAKYGFERLLNEPRHLFLPLRTIERTAAGEMRKK